VPELRRRDPAPGAEREGGGGGGKDERVFEGTVRCLRCGSTRHDTLRESLPTKVPIIVSWLDRSERAEFEVAPREVVRVGDRFDLPEGRVEVTSIEASGRRVEAAEGREIRTLWGKRVDKVVVKFSINRGTRTIPASLMAIPEEEFAVGDMVEVGKDKVVIHRIMKKGGALLREGSARAEEISRVYAKALRHGGLGTGD
jgi:uncharacterized Zn finger protein